MTRCQEESENHSTRPGRKDRQRRRPDAWATSARLQRPGRRCPTSVMVSVPQAPPRLPCGYWSSAPPWRPAGGKWLRRRKQVLRGGTGKRSLPVCATVGVAHRHGRWAGSVPPWGSPCILATSPRTSSACPCHPLTAAARTQGRWPVSAGGGRRRAGGRWSRRGWRRRRGGPLGASSGSGFVEVDAPAGLLVGGYIAGLDAG